MALSAVGAHEVDANSAPDLVADVAMLAQRASLPMPRVYMVDDPQPNAFATGRDPHHAAVAINDGLNRLLTRQERLGVIAHELAHIKNRDTLTMTITATLAGAISSITHMGMFLGGNRERGGLGIFQTLALLILAPLAAAIVQMAVSRGREYEADRFGGALCGNPLWLASALEKLHQGATAIPNDAVEARPSMAHLFIVNPLIGGFRDNLFSTHPDVGNRIAALNDLARQMGVTDAGIAPQSAPDSAPGKRWQPFGGGASSAQTEPQDSFLGGRGITQSPGNGPSGAKGPWG